MSEICLICCHCHGALGTFHLKWLVQNERLTCPTCQASYPVRQGVLNMLPQEIAQSDAYAAKGWKLDAFDEGYRQMGTYEDGFERARKTGVPVEFERFRYERVKGRILRQMELGRGMRLLDVGCGNGYYLREIERKFSTPQVQYCGVDISEWNIACFLKRLLDEGKNHFFPLVAMGECLPFENETFDVITCSEVIEHVVDPQKMIDEVTRVLKSGGTFYLSTPSKWCCRFWEALFFVPRVLFRVFTGRGLKDFFKSGVYDRPLSAWSLKRKLRRAGLRIIQFDQSVFLLHESYAKYLPKRFLAGWLKLAGFLERYAKLVFAPFGLHFVVACEKPTRNK